MLKVVVFVLLALAAPPLQGGSNYTVQADDTLSKIADKEYGNPLAFTAIVFFNNQRAAEDDTLTVIENPNILEVGWTLYLPTAEEANSFLIGNIPGGAFSEAPS